MASIKQIKQSRERLEIMKQRLETDEGKEWEKKIISQLEEIDFEVWWKQHYDGIDKVMTPNEAVDFLEGKLRFIMQERAFGEIKVSDEHINFIKFEIERHKKAEKTLNENISNEITLQEILPAIKVESLPMTPEQEAVWYKHKKEISQQENEALYNGIVKEFENNLLYCADEIVFIRQTIDLVKDHIKSIEAIPVLNSNGLPEKRRKPNRKQMLLPCYRKYIEYLENKLKEYLQPPINFTGIETNNFDLQGKTISSLQVNNPYFDSALNELSRKLETTEMLIERTDFIKAEIVRVETEQLNTPEIEVYGNWTATPSKFSFHDYVKQGYFDLQKGVDTPIENIISIAKLRCEQNDPMQFNLSKAYFETVILNSLRQGVALLQYKKHLLDLLNTTATNDQPKTKTKAVTKDEPETRTLKELFKYPEIYENCLQLLRDKEIINIENELMSGIDKGALLVWIKALEAKGLLKSKLIYKEQTSLLNQTFVNLNISPSTVKKKGGSKKAIDLYKDDFDEYFKGIRASKQ